MPRYLILLAFLTPVSLLAQSTKTNASPVSIHEVYSVLNFFIKYKKLDRNYKLSLTPEKNCTLDETDSTFLYSLLKKKPPGNNSDTSVIQIFSYPDLNILTKNDLKFIYKIKKLYTSFRWNSDSLGFSNTNKQGSYRLSFPYFTVHHDKVILMYDYQCPGLCGSGGTYLLTKKSEAWDVEALLTWWH